MKTLKYVLVRLLFEAIGLIILINYGLHYGTLEQTIIACFLYSLAFLGIIIISSFLQEDPKPKRNTQRNYRNCKEPYRWISGVDY